MSYAACVKRQKALARQMDRPHGYSNGRFITTDECLGCPQGEESKKHMETQAEYKTEKPEIPPATKTCKGEVCLAINPEGVSKPLSEFGPNKNSADKYNSICRPCNAWTVRKSYLKKKKGIQDPKPQDYIPELGGKNLARVPAKPKAGIQQKPADAAIQQKPLSAKEKLKNHFVKMMDAGSSLSEAYKVINGDRQDSYGSPENSFEIIADFWRAYLRQRSKAEDGKVTLSALDVAHMMALFKIARMLGQSPHRDNYIDAQGYLAIAADRLMPGLEK